MSLTKESLVEVFKKCYDPELQLDIWTLGLVYDYNVENDNVKVKMTFTTPACPYGPMLIEEVKSKLTEAGAKSIDIEIVFDPPWKPSEDLRAMLGI